MKVVLFCGGMGMRLREHSEKIPKPMVDIGSRPILWHLMKYYAHYGHTEFVLCLGWQAEVIKQYFLNYDECTSNDFVLGPGDRQVTLLNRDIHDWNITFVDTGIQASIGERLLAARKYLGDDEWFLANYADGLTDFHLPELVDLGRDKETIANMLAVRPSQSFHRVSLDHKGIVERMQAIRQTDVWMNGGYFMLHRDIFDFLHDGEDLVDDAFSRLIDRGQLSAIQHDGFWGCMDTYKEMQMFEQLHATDDMPWQVWRNDNKSEVQHKEAPAIVAAESIDLPLNGRR